MKSKKEDDELEDIELEDGDIIEFDEFNPKKKKDVKQGDIEKNFIFTISNGCPLCHGEVKGNDFYRYFCENCNVLFDKKDIMEKEFGKNLEEAVVRKRTLTDDDKSTLAVKRKELSGRIFDKFSPKEREELKKEAEEIEEKIEEPEEVEAEMIPPHPEEAEKEVEEEVQESASEPEEVEEKPRDAEYTLESSDVIIASGQSTKMHAGDCHFVRKIHPDNRIHLDSIDAGKEKGYEMCVCLRRRKARQR